MSVPAAEQAPVTHLDQPEIAFDAMSRKLAGLTAAIEGFAARQQELHARDYGPDLAKIHDRQDAVREAILKLNDRPAMALTPQLIASQIELAGAKGRDSDHQAWEQADRQLRESIQSIKGVVASGMTAGHQKLWIGATAAVALAVGFVLGAFVPTKIDQAVPEAWFWPESRAASILQLNGWDAGMRLLHVSDPERLRAISEAARVASDNAETIAGCRAHAVQTKNTVKCTVELRDPAAK